MTLSTTSNDCSWNNCLLTSGSLQGLVQNAVQSKTRSSIECVKVLGPNVFIGYKKMRDFNISDLRTPCEREMH